MGVAEIQKMSPSTTGRCSRHAAALLSNKGVGTADQSDGLIIFAGCSRPWCICCPVVVELVRTNLGPSFPLFHGLNSILNVKVLVGSGESPSRGFLHDCENRRFICSSTRRPHTDWLEIMKGER